VPGGVVNAEAFDLYLRGRQELVRQTIESNRQAGEDFNRALALQPDLARAQVGLADVWLDRYESPLDDQPRRNVEKLQRIATRLEQARLLDPLLPELQVALGHLARTRWKFDEAEQHFRQAIALNPNYAAGHAVRARNLLLLGQVDEALAEIRLAVALDPVASNLLSSAAMLYVEAGLPEAALPLADRALAANPASVQAFAWKLEALLALGRRAETLGIIHRRMEQDGGESGILMTLLAPAGERERTERWLAEQPPDSNAYLLVWGNLEVGRTAEALSALQADRLIPGNLENMIFLPVFDQIRDRPEFTRVLEEAGLVAAHARAQVWRQAHPPEKPAAQP